MPTSIANKALVAKLRQWHSAAVDADHSSQQAQTFRRAAASLSAHPSEVTSREEALKVKFVGEKLSSLLGQWMSFEQLRREVPLRPVAALQHDAEGKWWAVAVCGVVAWRSWGKRGGTGNRQGFDSWEQCATEAQALSFAVTKTKRQLAKEYAHAPGSAESYEAVSAEAPPARGQRQTAGRRGAEQPPAATGAAPAAADAGGTSEGAAEGAAEVAAGAAGAAAEVVRAKRSWVPKLLDSHGEVGAPAAVLLALRRAAADGEAPLSTAELARRAQPLCPTVALETRGSGKGGGRDGGKGGGKGGGRGRGGVQLGALSGVLKAALRNGVVEVAGGARARGRSYSLTETAGPTAAACQPSGAVLATRLAEALELPPAAWSEALCLDTVVERKATSDFIATLRDGRHYHSQKARLRRCGLPRAVYLVEGSVERWQHAAERRRMRLELAKIEVVDGLLTHRTRGTADTMAFLATAVRRLAHACAATSGAELQAAGALSTFGAFCARTCPARSSSAEFACMLLSLDGMTAPKIERLVRSYPTARAVGEALDAHVALCRDSGLPAGSREEGWLFAELLEPGHSRKALSTKLSTFFGAWQYADGAEPTRATALAWPRPG